MDDAKAADQPQTRESYEAPRLVEIGPLLQLTASDQYSFISGGDFAVLSSVTN